MTRSTRRLTKNGLIVGSVTALVLTGCTQAPATTPTGKASGAAGSDKNLKVALVVNTPFGDNGPKDAMAKALKEDCQDVMGFEIKKLESLSPTEREADVRAMAEQGYGLIITTFPDMSAATAAVAPDFPDAKFAAIYQFINTKTPVPNVWDNEVEGKASAYVSGAVASALSTSGRLGFIAGAEDPTVNQAMRNFKLGAVEVRPDAVVEFAYANSFTDPAKGKEIAQTMIDHGVDLVRTSAAQTQLGALDAAKTHDILFIGDNGDNSAIYPTGYVSYVRTRWDLIVKKACQDYKDGTLQGGVHSPLGLKEGFSEVPTDLIEKWGKASGREDDAAKALELVANLTAKIKADEITLDTSQQPPASK